MGKEFSTTPQTVPQVSTKHRRIVSAIPHPDSVPMLERMREGNPEFLAYHDAFAVAREAVRD